MPDQSCWGNIVGRVAPPMATPAITLTRRCSWPPISPPGAPDLGDARCITYFRVMHRASPFPFPLRCRHSHRRYGSPARSRECRQSMCGSPARPRSEAASTLTPIGHLRSGIAESFMRPEFVGWVRTTPRLRIVLFVPMIWWPPGRRTGQNSESSSAPTDHSTVVDLGADESSCFIRRKCQLRLRARWAPRSGTALATVAAPIARRHQSHVPQTHGVADDLGAEISASRDMRHRGSEAVIAIAGSTLDHQPSRAAFAPQCPRVGADLTLLRPVVMHGASPVSVCDAPCITRRGLQISGAMR